MSATHQWSESNGSGEVVTDGIANINMGDNDSTGLIPANYPVAAGNNAYEKYIRAKFSGVFTEISNMKFWKSGGDLKTGEVIKAAANQVYVQPVKTTSIVATSNIPIIISSALVILSDIGNTTIIGTDTGYTGYIVIQLQTTISTPGGSLNQKTLSMQYDEV